MGGKTRKISANSLLVSLFSGNPSGSIEAPPYTTPSFFCRLVDDVVYWNTRRLSGKM